MTLPANYKEIKLSKAAARLLRRAGNAEAMPLVYHITHGDNVYFVKTSHTRMVAVSADLFGETDGGFRFDGKRNLVRVESPESEAAAKLAKAFLDWSALATERVTLHSAAVEFEEGSPCFFGIPHSRPMFTFHREGKLLTAPDSHETVTHCMNYEVLKIASRWWMDMVHVPVGSVVDGLAAPWRFANGTEDFIMFAMPMRHPSWE